MAAYYDPSSSDDDGSESLSSAEEAAPGASHNTSGASDDDTYSGSDELINAYLRETLRLHDATAWSDHIARCGDNGFATLLRSDPHAAPPTFPSTNGAWLERRAARKRALGLGAAREAAVAAMVLQHLRVSGRADAAAALESELGALPGSCPTSENDNALYDAASEVRSALRGRDYRGAVAVLERLAGQAGGKATAPAPATATAAALDPDLLQGFLFDAFNLECLDLMADGDVSSAFRVALTTLAPAAERLPETLLPRLEATMFLFAFDEPAEQVYSSRCLGRRTATQPTDTPRNRAIDGIVARLQGALRLPTASRLDRMVRAANWVGARYSGDCKGSSLPPWPGVEAVLATRTDGSNLATGEAVEDPVEVIDDPLVSVGVTDTEGDDPAERNRAR